MARRSASSTIRTHGWWAFTRFMSAFIGARAEALTTISILAIRMMSAVDRH
jgi:hypothetical protein